MTAEAITTEDQAIVGYLATDWRQVFHLTTVAQAAVALGLPLDDAGRRRIGDHLGAHPELSPVLRRWGPLTLTLTEEEKLLGRVLALASNKLTEPELRNRTGLDDHHTRDGLQTLVRFGLLSGASGSYELAAGWRKRLGPLGWNFHRVAVEGEAPFNVP